MDLVYPQTPSNAGWRAVRCCLEHTTTEVDTVFENIVNLLDMVERRSRSVLSAVAEGVRGQGERMGQATTDLNEVLTALNARSDKIRDDWRSFKRFSDTYGAAADNIVKILNAASTTSSTVTGKAKALDSLLLNVIGFSRPERICWAPTGQPRRRDQRAGTTTSLLLKYSPGLRAGWRAPRSSSTTGCPELRLRRGRWPVLILDGCYAMPEQNPYVFPDNLPINAAKGGPGGQPGCGSLPDVARTSLCSG